MTANGEVSRCPGERDVRPLRSAALEVTPGFGKWEATRESSSFIWAPFCHGPIPVIEHVSGTTIALPAAAYLA